MARLLIRRPLGLVYPDNNAGKIAAILGGREPQFSFTTPADPITSSGPVEVDSSTAAASLATNGRITVLTAGTYGALRLSGNDMEVIVNSGVTTGTIQIEGVRIRIRSAAGAARDHTINNMMNWPWDAGSANRTDYLFDGLNVVSGEGAQGSHQNQFGMQRFAIINCYMDSVGFTAWLSEFGGVPQDVFLGQSYLNANRIASDQSTTQAVFRASGGWQRVLLVDSRLRNDDGAGGGRQHLRLHSNNVASEHAWIRNCDFVGTNSQIRPNTAPGVNPDPASMTNIVFDSCRWYPYNSPGQSVPTVGSGSTNDPNATNVTIQNNTLYTGTGNSFSNPGGAWTLSGNTVTAAVSPPTWVWPS